MSSSILLERTFCVLKRYKLLKEEEDINAILDYLQQGSYSKIDINAVIYFIIDSGQ